MTLSNEEKQDVKEMLSLQEKYLLEVISGDRKAHAIHFKAIEANFVRSENNQEVMLLKIEAIVKALNAQCKTCENKEDLEGLRLDLDRYKQTMKPYEIMQNWKRIPFITACILFDQKTYI